MSKSHKKSKIGKPRGTRDLFPEEMERRRYFESIMRSIAESYGYGEIQTPAFENLELFTIKSGEDVVDEIYSFQDKGGRGLALRPELTAPVLRAYVNEMAVATKPLRFYYFGNCFRYERPQKARYREFWQFGIELIGSESYLADAEVILMAYEIMRQLNLDFELRIGHVGLLRHLLEDVEEENASKIMRLIDKEDMEGLEEFIDQIGLPQNLKDSIYSLIKTSGGREILSRTAEFVPNFDFTYLEELCDVLDSMNIEYSLDFGIARGLDYYTGVVFEGYATSGLGAQSQICGGGSYRLAHLFGGGDTPSTGFALGFDRIADICEIELKEDKVVAVINMGLESEALKTAKLLREKTDKKVVVDVMDRPLKKQMKFANYVNAHYAVIIGEREMEENKYGLKDMVTGEQRLVDKEELIHIIQQL
ncbi:MAG: histidine--tRNA ligase [Archaeoglobaceae archaeon]